MSLLGAAILLIVCFAGGLFARKKWVSGRKRSFMALWVLLLIASIILALYMVMTFILINAVR